MVAAPGAAPPRLASAALRWPRSEAAASPPPSPPPRARRLRKRRPEIGWSRDGWRRTAASKPAPAGLGVMKKKETNKLAKRLGGGGEGPGRRGLALRARARSRPARSPGLPLLCGEAQGWARGSQRLLAALCAPRWRACFYPPALRAAGLLPAAPPLPALRERRGEC